MEVTNILDLNLIKMFRINFSELNSVNRLLI